MEKEELEGSINYIEEERRRINKYFTENNYIKDTEQVINSPINKLRIVKRDYKQKKEDINWVASKIEIYDKYDILKRIILIDNSEFFYKFIHINQVEFLVFAEVLCGGNSVLNLDTFELFSFSDGTDGFISAEYYVSPDTKRLAIFGCFWASSYFIKIFDITKIEYLPWPCIHEIHLKEDAEIQLKWISDRKIHLIEFDSNKQIQDITYEVK